MAEGSQFIASEYALYKILSLIEKFEPKTILEAGVGIGTISDSILRTHYSSNLKVYGTESNAFCLEQLPLNMGEKYNSLHLYPDIQSLPEELKFDFIIIDGKEEALASLKKNMKNRCIIVIEGDRRDQTEIITNLFSHSKFVHSITSKRNNIYSNRPKYNFQGGLKIIFTNPDLKQKVEWLKLKMASKIHFQLRKFI
ncbi:hypothetical protein C723_2765 [Christiangramia flava JLT2011]|uniref:Uncharacterized protein n=1 Tax=Christiangramia flava JLT2011 TaxID=1229726 RepID=A0A1L7I689_9FLAO|nr:hypothetical protein GRFL_2394 [Christiangramia flava JLT2011]OSS38281.1 hypothetical protein C723_2765 [Christiangramia flava JLT2011]